MPSRSSLASVLEIGPLHVWPSKIFYAGMIKHGRDQSFRGKTDTIVLLEDFDACTTTFATGAFRGSRCQRLREYVPKSSISYLLHCVQFFDAAEAIKGIIHDLTCL